MRTETFGTPGETRLDIRLGGSTTNNLADNLYLLGLNGNDNLYKRVYTVYGGIAKSLYPQEMPVVLPLTGREIPIIADAQLVSMEFGTGAVKVTPAHDFNDFATGKRHKLEEINIFNKDGTLNDQAGPFQGMERYAARKSKGKKK